MSFDHLLCNGCGTQLHGPKDAYPVQHVDGDSLMLCLECATILLEEGKAR